MRRFDFDDAVAALTSGQVVAIPTDTVYGVAAALDQPRAVEQLFTLKGRPSAVALPVLVAEVSDIIDLGIDFDARSQRVAARFWPGPLTIVVRAPENIAARVHAEDGTVGLRIPGDELTRRLLGRTGPLCVTSANVHGEAPCTSADLVEGTFEGRSELAGVLDGGARYSPVSTVVDLSSEQMLIRRRGAVREDELREILSEPGSSSPT